MRVERNNSKRYLWIAGGVVLICAAILAWSIFFRTSNPLQAIERKATFPIYRPVPLPKGYRYDKHSIRAEQGVIFYDLTKDASVVHVSQQPVPTNPPDLNRIEGFTKFETLAGSAAIGSTSITTTALLLTNTTLVTINAAKNIPKDSVAQIVRSLSSGQ